MRIIAGEYRGRKINAPQGKETRPTLDYIRESIFNSIQQNIYNANVLDLFAGSGAFALEAISRGAQNATLIDASSSAIKCISENVEILKCQDYVKIHMLDWEKAIAMLGNEQQSYSIIFLDPPYKMHIIEKCCQQMQDNKVLADNCLLIVETEKEYTPILGKSFIHKKSKGYRDIQIHFYQYNKEN